MADAHPTMIDAPERSGAQVKSPAVGDEPVHVPGRFRLRLNLPLAIGSVKTGL